MRSVMKNKVQFIYSKKNSVMGFAGSVAAQLPRPQCHALDSIPSQRNNPPKKEKKNSVMIHKV